MERGSGTALADGEESSSTFTLRSQVPETSLIGSSTVYFVDHQGNKILGAVSGVIDYQYQVPYDLWQYADKLDPSIAGDYEFSRVYLQLKNMQKECRYIYLGTPAEVGLSDTGYKIYFFMNSIEESKAGGVYNGTWYSFSKGTKKTDDIYIVFNHVEDVAFSKVDHEGDPVSGAEFTLYTDESCINVFTKNGSAVTAISDADGRVNFSRIPYGTYYMKETATPSEFKENGKVYTVNVNGNTKIDDIVNEDDDGSVIVKETKAVTIKKEWSDDEDHSDDSVTIKLFAQGEEAASVTINANNSWTASITELDPTVSYVVSETSVTSSGEDVTSEWIPTISSGTSVTSTAYYQANGFLQGEQYVIVYNGNTALSNSGDSLSTKLVSVRENMLTTSSVNNNMLWTVASLSDDGVISLKNAANGRYLNLNNAGSTSSSWGMTIAEPQFVRYIPNNGTVQIFYRENINAAAAYYMNNGTEASTDSGTSFTLYKKVNVRNETVTVTNRPAEYTVMMQKLDYDSDTAVSGAAFNLYTEEEYNNGNPGTPVYTGLTSGTDGYLSAEGSKYIQLFAGTYYLVETQAAAGYAELSKPVKFTISRGGRFTARSDDQEFTNYTYASTVTEGETSYPLLKVPNQQKHSLTVSKTVNGSLGSKNKIFSFTLTMASMAGKDVQYSADDGERETVAFDAQGQTTFTLRHGQSVTFYDVIGNYTVEEAMDGYTTTYQINDEDPQEGATVAGVFAGEDASVAFTNTLDVVPPTGIHDSIAFALIGLIAAAGLGATACLGRRRNQNV